METLRSGRMEGQRLINVLLRLSLEATALFVTVFESISKNLSFLSQKCSKFLWQEALFYFL